MFPHCSISQPLTVVASELKSGAILKKSKWDHYSNYLGNGSEVAISVTGENKNTGDEDF